MTDQFTEQHMGLRYVRLDTDIRENEPLILREDGQIFIGDEMVNDEPELIEAWLKAFCVRGVPYICGDKADD